MKEMRIQNNGATKAKNPRQRQRCERFAAGAADSIGTNANCLFSLLPYEERVRQTASWYDACTEAMLRGNYSLLDEWIRGQACLAETQHFELEDLLQLLRACRRSAIEIDGWDEDVFSAVDEVINEGLRAIRGKVSWTISENLDYLKQSEGESVLPANGNAPKPSVEMETRDGERREFGRNRLALPIRVLCTAGKDVREEITRTHNVSMTGIYFRTQSTYKIGTVLKVVYPYWTDPGSINKEYSARVTRIDGLPGEFWGIAVEFLRNLRKKTP